MDSPVPHTVTVRGKDLPGAVMVMPMGLDAAIKKRVSGEFKSEKSGNSLTFGTVSGGLGGPGVSQASFQQKQSSQFSQMTSSSGGGDGMSSANNMSSSMMSSSQQKSFQQTSMSSASSFERSSFSSSSQQKKTNRVSGGFQDFSVHGEEIRQAKLKDQLHSAMSDLESEIGQEYKENVSSNVMNSPTPSKGPHQEAFSPTPPSKHEYFSPPPLEAVPKPEPVSIASPVPVSFSPAPQKQPTPVSAPAPFSMSHEPVRNQQEPVSVAAPFSMSPEPAALPAQQPEMVAAPFSMEPVVRNQMASASMQNGFSDFGQSVTDFGSSYKSESSFMSSQQQETSFMSSQKQESSFMSSQKQESSFMSSKQQENYSASKQESFSSSSTLNRALEVESAGGQLQESDSNSSLLQKIMTPASNDFDSSSLKRRDPRKMFTDSSFYSSKHHPTVADQVEMAHRLTSALFKEDNKNSKGQQMYLNRMKKSGEESDMEDYCMPKRDAVPNMKLVMNPEGKVHEWNDMDPSELPNAALLAGHAAPSLPSPEIINPMIEDLNSNTGRGGELFAKRRKRAENWVVDENNTSKTKPSAFADHFIQEQEQQQQQFKQQQALEQAAQSAEEREYLAQQQQKLQQEKQQAQQQFRSQQQLKQEQSLEFRRQQEAMMFSEQQELPPNFKRTDLKQRSFTPSLDLSIHNVQGINVWANTAPRGWGAQKGAKKGGLPTVSVSPATPSVDQQQIKIQQQREEQLRFEQEQKLEMARQEQMLLEQQMEKQRIEDQKMMEEQLRIEEEQRLEEERRMEEQRRFEQERQMEEQRRFEEEQRRAEQQRMEEQRRIEEQRMEEQRMEQQRMEQQRMEEQRMELQRMEQQRIEQQRMEQQRMEEQRMEQQRIEQQRMEQQRMEQQRMEQQRMEQQRMEQQRMEQQRMEQQRMEEQRRYEEQRRMEEQRRVEEQKRLSGMEMMSQQQQSFNQTQAMSFQQSSQSSHQQSMSYEQSSQYQQSYAQSSQSDIYESTEFESGLKGYKPKGVEMANGDVNHRPAMKMIQNNGIFGGITGDQNSLLEDAQFDSKKHSVRDLVGHFSKVKPKAQIPVQYLPEQKIYNGNQGPSLNYLNSSNESATLPRAASSTKKDFDASRQDYEMKKQMQNNTSTTSSSTTAMSNNTQQSSVETRSRSAVSAENKQLLNSRRQSLKDLLYFDTENNRGSSAAGIIDPSAILRGSEEPNSDGLLTHSNIAGKNETNSGKWDNHNTIARGWAGPSANYHPVTFRAIYNVEAQKPVSSM